MRILHTADLHLGDKLGGVDRTDDQLCSLDRIMDYCDKRRADVLVIAGDVFNDYHGDSLSRMVGELARRLGPRLRAGLRTVIIPGNHDREHVFRLLETVQTLSGEEASRRIHFVGRPKIIRLSDPSGSFQVQFALAPYPTVERYLRSEELPVGAGLAERNRALGTAYARNIAAARAQVDPRLPAVLVAHVFVRSAVTSGLFRMTEAEDIPIEPQDVPDWAYAAFGHIHRAQAIGGRNYVRYAGSPERLDAGERDDEKSCVLIELDANGRRSEPELLPLPASTFYTIAIEGAEGMEGLAERYPDHESALTAVRVTYRSGQDNPMALLADLGRLFPRCYKKEFVPLGETPATRRPEGDPRDLAGTVQGFLEARLQPSSERERLIELASELIAEVRDAAVAD